MNLTDTAMDQVISAIRLRIAFNLVTSRHLPFEQAKSLAYLKLKQAAEKIAEESTVTDGSR